MKVPASFRYRGPMSGLLKATRAEAVRREAPADEARWGLLAALLALVLALHCADAPQPAPVPVVPAIAHI